MFGARLVEQRQLAQLLGDGEAVARLGLERRDAPLQNASVRRREAIAQRVVVGSARGDDAGPDASAAGGDLREGGAGQPLGVLVVALAAEQRVGVALDEAGEHRPAAGVDGDHVGITPLRPHCVGTADRDDHTIADRDRAVGDEIELALRRPTTRRAAIADERDLGGVENVEVVHVGVGMTATTSISISHSG